MLDPPAFVPLRTDPPPSLRTTLWIRSALVLAVLAVACSVLLVAVLGGRSDVSSGALVVVAHLAVLALLARWSRAAMSNADALVPATRYTPGARGTVAVVLWCAALVAPSATVVVVSTLGSEFADVEAFAPTAATIGLVLAALLVAWLPFRYHALQARRIGAPHGVMTAWFWLPLLTFVGAISMLALGPPGRFDGGGTIEPAARVEASYVVAACVFAWTTWRAVTVFDEVIDLRWRRWKTEWEQTLADMASQPVPGPESGGRR